VSGGALRASGVARLDASGSSLSRKPKIRGNRSGICESGSLRCRKRRLIEDEDDDEHEDEDPNFGA